ncbi:hypothetical protein AJ79_06300 [Helicocarpus griseus UAMH5409]|uniref:Uncharacterized protein n=1 Tax=Helicocarpus griseus UAMH5409 TaxID=1447875 RepID=A0A2B7XFM7_9EURO|nr:hypothetical protein AJ79_06300 [Helicocarpus griseus UAMH5409]
MAPIRVGLIGLNTNVYDGGNIRAGTWGVVHLTSISKSPHYKLVALCNSTAEKARKSIEHHKLDPATKAYGSVDELARDPDVDLIVVCVHVDKHYALAKTALENKKSVFSEFPLSNSYPEVEELVELAKQGGVKTIVGAQARGDLALRKVKNLVDSKAIGDVVSSSWVAHLPRSTWDGLPEAVKFFLDLEGGPSRINVGLGHSLEPFTHVLGEFKDIQTVFKTHGKTTRLFDDTGNVVDPAYKVTAPEYILIQGVLNSGAVASITLRCTSDSADEAGHRWIISGTEGELQFTIPAGNFIQIQGHLSEAKVLLKRWKGETEEVDFKRNEPAHVSSVTGDVINTARLYESFATGDEDGYPSFESARKVHHLIDRMKKVAVWAP